MSKSATYTEVLFPVRLDKPLKSEIERMAEALNMSKSDLVRFSIHFSIKKGPNKLQQIMDSLKKESDAWYQKRNEGKKNV